MASFLRVWIKKKQLELKIKNYTRRIHGIGTNSKATLHRMRMFENTLMDHMVFAIKVLKDALIHSTCKSKTVNDFKTKKGKGQRFYEKL